MTVKECANYNPMFPEKFPWGSIESISLTNVAFQIVNHIEHDLRSKERNLVPGLRVALNQIAEYAKV